jgi:hypothetical protein
VNRGGGKRDLFRGNESRRNRNFIDMNSIRINCISKIDKIITRFSSNKRILVSYIIVRKGVIKRDFGSGSEIRFRNNEDTSI